MSPSDKTPAPTKRHFETPRCWSSVGLRSAPGLVRSFCLDRTEMLFDKEGFPIAICVGDVVYFPDQEHIAADTRKINAFYPDAPHMRVGAADFDFQVGAALTSAGLRLTVRPKEGG